MNQAEAKQREQTLLSKIMDASLRSSLDQLRQAMADLWSPDPPRIIQDYTDHGLDHVVRVVGLAAKLLEAPRGQALTEKELYLLLAGAYLHDIGMQCDVTKLSNVLEKASGSGTVISRPLGSLRGLRTPRPYSEQPFGLFQRTCSRI